MGDGGGKGRAAERTDLVCALLLLRLVLVTVSAPAVVEISDVAAVPELLFERLVDLVMDMAAPRRGRGAR